MTTLVNFLVFFHAMLFVDQGRSTRDFSIVNNHSRMFCEAVGRKVNTSEALNKKYAHNQFDPVVFHSALAPLKNFLKVSDIVLNGNTLKPIRKESSLSCKLLKFKKNQTLAERCKQELLNDSQEQNFLSFETIVGLGVSCFKKINENIENLFNSFSSFTKSRIFCNCN